MRERIAEYFYKVLHFFLGKLFYVSMVIILFGVYYIPGDKFGTMVLWSFIAGSVFYYVMKYGLKIDDFDENIRKNISNDCQ